MPSLNDLEGYAGETEASLLQLGALILAGGDDPGTSEVAGHAGVALTIVRLLRALPRHAARGQCYLPADLMAKHGVDRESLLAGVASPPLAALIGELCTIAAGHLAAARDAARGMDTSLLPAFLPLAPVDMDLKALRRSARDPFRQGTGPAPWRRQWAIWRAARRGMF